MEDKKKETFGEVFFSELSHNDYLDTIYEDILFNYGLKETHLFHKKKRDIPVKDALEFADLLSKSNHSKLADMQKMQAQGIIAMLQSLYPDNQRVSYAAGSVLEAAGNYRGRSITESSYNGTDFMDRLAAGYKKNYYAVPGEDGRYFTALQKAAFDSFTDAAYFSYSGSSAAETAYPVRMFIKRRVLSGAEMNFTLVLPSAERIHEAYRSMTEDLGESLQKSGHRIMTAGGGFLPGFEEKNRNYIFIMTAEQLLSFLADNISLHLDYLFILDAHAISEGDEQSASYPSLVHMLSGREDRTKIYFASTGVPNPQIYLKLIPGADMETLHGNGAYSAFSAAVQHKFIIDAKKKEASIYNDHARELIALGQFTRGGAALSDILLLFGKNEYEKEAQNLIYVPTDAKAIAAARDYAEKRIVKTGCTELSAFADEIRATVHNDFFLADLIEEGIAYMTGHLPPSIRQRIQQLYREEKITSLFFGGALSSRISLQADNIFIEARENKAESMTPDGFRNLAGCAGRLKRSLYGRVFLIAENDKAKREYERLLKADIRPKKLSAGKEIADEQGARSGKDQREALHDAIRCGRLNFPHITSRGDFDDSELSNFLERLCEVFGWEVYEPDTLGYVNRRSNRHTKLSRYRVILGQWVRGYRLNEIISRAIEYKERRPKGSMYISQQYADYDFSAEHKNIVIAETLSVIEEIILTKLSDYLLKASKAYKEINGRSAENDWSEFARYGSADPSIISLQKCGFTRETAMDILDQPALAVQADLLKLNLNAVNACKNEKIKREAELIRRNIPELFI